MEHWPSLEDAKDDECGEFVCGSWGLRVNNCPIFPYYNHYAIKLVLLNFDCVFQENECYL